MRQRWKVLLFVLLGLLAALPILTVTFGWQPIRAASALMSRVRPPIRIGLLHSRTGFLAVSEQSVLDAETLAIEEINASGGIGGQVVLASAPDCRSDPATFAAVARDLIDKEQAAALFGCWTSECRKAVLPVVVERSSLLFFPGNYEGMETSNRAIYTGGAANQSVLPAVRWAFDSLKARRFYIIGLEEVWSRSCAEIARDAVKAAGAEVVGERYVPQQSGDIDPTLEAIRQANPDVVLNFFYGETNIAFYAAYHRAGLSPETTPTIAFGFSEDESRRFTPADVAGHFAAWNYFQSLNRDENQAFIRRFRARFGETRTIGDAMVAAYNAVWFWARAAREVDSVEIAVVLNNLDRQSLDAPEGIVTIDSESRAVWRPFHVGRLRPDGQFEIIYSIVKPIRPVSFIGTRPTESWRAFRDGLNQQWHGRWSGDALAGAARAEPAAR